MNGNGGIFKVIAFFILVVGSIWAMISVHAQTPHKDAVDKDEFALVLRELDGMNRRLDRLMSLVESK